MPVSALWNALARRTAPALARGRDAVRSLLQKHAPGALVRLRAAGPGLGAAAFLAVIAAAAVHRPGTVTARSEPATAAAGTPARAKAGAPAAAAETPPVTLGDALGRRWVNLSCRGHGREEARVSLVSQVAWPLRLQLPVGLIFDGADGMAQMVSVREAAVALAPRESRTVRVPAAAARLDNRLDEQSYQLVANSMLPPSLEKLLTRVRACPEASAAAVQTAVLVVLENPPLSAFARFNLLAAGAAPGLSGDAFRVSTPDLVAALNLLKEAGIPRQDIAAAQEPQLRVEAMVDPLAHAGAQRLYGISADKEWNFWREELLHGDASTRHYALYGIGRYYPAVALQMLPTWARDRRVSLTYRQSAVLALAETRRPEAISLLQQLTYELGPNTELGLSARRAQAYLENACHGAPDVANAAGVEFKVSQAELPLP